MATPIHFLRLEAATLRGDAMRTHEAASEAAQALQHAGAAALAAATQDALGDDPAPALEERAGRLRAAAFYALAQAAELVRHAGRLEQLAATRKAVDVLGPSE